MCIYSNLIDLKFHSRNMFSFLANRHALHVKSIYFELAIDAE